MERKIEEKIIWINSNYKYSGIDNNFIYDIADISSAVKNQ